MKSLYPLILFLLLVNSNTIAQNLIAVQNGGAPAFFTKLSDALTNTQDGDTIYIPGGSFDNLSINKKLNIIGVGHHPDSTLITAKTLITSLTFNSGSDGSSIQGLSLGNSSISFNADSYNLTVYRCYFGGITSNNHTITNLSLRENIIGSINNIVTLINSSICNNIFYGQCYTKSGCVVKNNIFLYYNPNVYGGNYSYSGVSSSIYNNICYTTSSSYYSYCVLRNNLNFNTASYGIGNQGSGNFEGNVSLQSVFENYDPATMSGENIYKADFHLKVNSLYKNSGTDGTDIGIYGGAYPWKTGSIPSNPHFQRVEIAPKTDNNGNLNVKIKVAAQDH